MSACGTSYRSARICATPGCGARVAKDDHALCPLCHREKRVKTRRECEYCGGPMVPDGTFCPRCDEPRHVPNFREIQLREHGGLGL